MTQNRFTTSAAAIDDFYSMDDFADWQALIAGEAEIEERSR